ncbi:hypothetical protein AB0E83_08445 [Streptomyces sp. NPDC035033]|uniref:hypothetical protein n=1 Tax=Streptomyces sp. NPDC035033 TaxID=3155368 RepID=UPI0034039903
MASAMIAAVVLQGDDVTVAAVCVPVRGTDRDKAASSSTSPWRRPANKDDTDPETRAAFFATSSDGTHLQTERAREKDAIAHQSPEWIGPGCTDIVHAP